MSNALKDTSRNILPCIQYGHAVPINDAAKEKREKLGMTPVPETVCMYPNALRDVRMLLELCGFDKLCASQTPA